MADDGRGLPSRLPAVDASGKVPAVAEHTTAPGAKVVPCAAQLDPEVESWFEEPEERVTTQTRWLRSTTSTAAQEVSRRLLGQATREFEVGAWLSAETSAWDALHWAAESVDLSARERGEGASPSARASLQAAKDAVRESRDFSGLYGPLDVAAIRRMAVSHQTDLLDREALEGLTATDASDRYLDDARVRLAPIAKQSVEAAQAMDLLAAIVLRRADAKTLPSATALAFRRAALQGQPRNASLASRLGMHLADVGLYDEARWALEHSLSIENDPRTANALVNVLRRTGKQDQASQLLAQVQHQINGHSLLAAANGSAASDGESPTNIRVPQITELSPEDFAAISQPVVPFERSESGIQATAVGVKLNQEVTESATTSADILTGDAGDQVDDSPGLIRRFFGTLKRIW